jgi:hypothetical protein
LYFIQPFFSLICSVHDHVPPGKSPSSNVGPLCKSKSGREESKNHSSLHLSCEKQVRKIYFMLRSSELTLPNLPIHLLCHVSLKLAGPCMLLKKARLDQVGGTLEQQIWPSLIWNSRRGLHSYGCCCGGARWHSACRAMPGASMLRRSANGAAMPI